MIENFKYTKLSISYILKFVTQESIMEYYTNIKISEKTLTANSFTNPFRIDNNPSCMYYYTDNNKLYFRDYSGYKLNALYHGDCFDIAGNYYKLSCKNKTEMLLILRAICDDLNIFDNNKRFNSNTIINNYHKLNIKTYKIIPRKINLADIKYFNSVGILDTSVLSKNYVYCVNTLIIDEQICYTYSHLDPAYAYYQGKDIDTLKQLWQVYFPKRIKGRKFIQNKLKTKFIRTLIPDEFLVITKSAKDCLALQSYGIQSIALGSENSILTEEEYYSIKYYFNYIICLLDNDNTGKAMAYELKKRYNIIPLFFPLYYGIKDFSEFHNKYGEEKTRKLIELTKNHLINKLYDKKYFKN